MRIPSLIAALAALAPIYASAGLVFDIRLINSDTCRVPSATGQVFNFVVLATVTGNDDNPSNDTLQSAVGYIRSTGELEGNLTHTLTSPFNGNGSFHGAIADRDGDGDLDVGGAGTTTETPGQISYRSPFAVSGAGPIHIGSGTFTVTQLGAAGQILFHLATPSGLNQNPLFTIDGVPMNAATGAGLVSVGSSIHLFTGAPPPPALIRLDNAPDGPTFVLNVVKGIASNQYSTPNPLSAGEELPAGGINKGSVFVSGFSSFDTPIFLLLGLNQETGLDGYTGGGACDPSSSFTRVPRTDPQFATLKLHYPWLDALFRADHTHQNVINFDLSGFHGLMVTEIAVVPEPITPALAAVTALALLTRRRPA